MTLTKPEREVVNLLAYTWNAFLKLESPPADKHDFAHAVHQAQNIVMARPAARQYQATLERTERMKGKADSDES